jgi:hypothetical protein
MQSFVFSQLGFPFCSFIILHPFPGTSSSAAWVF